MSVQTVRFRTRPDDVPAVTERIDALFAAVRAAAPPRMRYLALREVDRPLFTLVLELPDDSGNPLPSIPEAARFREWLPGVVDDDVSPRRATVLGRYGA